MFCPRNSLPPSPPIEEIELRAENNSIDAITGPENQAITWQQKTDFPQTKTKRKTGRVQWVPLSLEVDLAAQVIIAVHPNNSWAAQQAEFFTTVEQPRQKARGKAAASTSAHSITPLRLAPAKPLVPHTPNSNNVHNTSKQTLTRPSRNKSNTKDIKMSAQPKGMGYLPPHLLKKDNAKGREYVPPHLRDGFIKPKEHVPKAKEYVLPHLRNNSAASAKGCVPIHVRNHNSANGSPAMSPKSNSKLHSSPNGANQHQGVPPSPPTTPREPGQPKLDAYGGWDFSDCNLAPAGKKAFGNPRWPRGPQPHKKTVWPKNRDMKYIPHSSDDEWGVRSQSNSNGDPDYDVKKLLDWNGEWLPAPESWSCRKGHEDRHFGQHIEEWMNKESPECINPVCFPQHAFNGHAKTTKVGDKTQTKYVLDEGQVLKEVAPRYWAEAKVGGMTMRDALKELCDLKLESVDARDMTDHAPWWDRYEDIIYAEDGQDNPSPFINPLEVPDAKIDFADHDPPLEEWQLASSEAKVQARKKRMDDKKHRMLARRDRPTASLAPPAEDRRLRPEANIYIRPVQPGDVRGIAEIYNWYIDNTIHAVEFDGRTEAQMAQRISDITTAGLPYLVAIDRGNRSRLTNEYVNERIVGFVKLEDYCGQSTLFRYTFDMELFVHPGFVKKGIAKCLMDRILEMVDTSYNARGGYQYINNFDYLKNGPSRVIKTILLNVHHKNGGESMETGWQSKFLSAFKFSRSGRLPKVGYKNDKVIDVSIFAHHTREDIVASGRPTIAG
ncbi:hypothetical protein Ptr902_08233 [Pyrenophora tritici-repentis]|nr:hypothetical protein Ptr902_08233 [Pyrenophora tritici-repentis]